MPTSPADRTFALARTYRQFAGAAAGRSPLHERVALAVSESDEALHAIGTGPARGRRPERILAALHDLALAGRAPELAAAYRVGDGDAAARAAIGTLLGITDEVAALAARRKAHALESECCAAVYLLVAEAAYRTGANAVGLVDVGAASLSLHVDLLGLSYSNGQSLGDPSSPVRLSASVVGHQAVPTRAVPEVVARVAVDPDPLDLTDPDDARWLRAWVGPDQPDEAARLEAQLQAAAAAPALLVRGDPVEMMADALALVPADALPVVITTWALSRLPLERRLRFLDRLGEAAAHRTVAWVSAEGVGVAPAIPTFGDRHASGHSILGLALLEDSTLRAEAVGRCWYRGRMLSWLAPASP